MLISRVSPALEQGPAHTSDAAVGVMVIVPNITNDRRRGAVVARRKRLIPLAEDVVAWVQNRRML